MARKGRTRGKLRSPPPVSGGHPPRGMEKLVSLAGIVVILGLAWLMSDNRRRVDWRLVGSGIAMQIVFGLIVLKTTPGQQFFEYAKVFFEALLGYSDEGAKFVFGVLALPPGVQGSLGFFFACRVLPTIIFISAVMAMAYHLNLMQPIIRVIAKAMALVLRTSGAETTSVAANIFVGQTEAALVVRPYVGSMTRSELMTLMVGGMATIATGVLAAYVAMGINAGHLLAASVMAAPGAIVIAKILTPETGEPLTRGDVKIELPKTNANVVDALANGASEGLKLAANVGAMLIAFIAVLAMMNGLLGWLGGWFGYPKFGLDVIFSTIFFPLAVVMGVPVADAGKFATMMGTMLTGTEFLAYLQLSEAIKTGAISERAAIIGTYAFCGFANFGSIGIQIGGISVLAPERRADLAQLGFRAMCGGALACYLTGTVAGLLL